MKTMNLVKDEAKKLIERLPDTSTWDDIMYELYVKKKIAAGLKAAEEGRIVSHEEAKKMLLSK
jgi:predicted transcriptional regulator